MPPNQYQISNIKFPILNSQAQSTVAKTSFIGHLKFGIWHLAFCIPARGRAGFTLIEILIAIGILATVAILAIPNFRSFNNNRQLDDAVADITRLMRQAQSSASSGITCPGTTNISHYGWKVRIKKDGDNLNYSLLCTYKNPPPSNSYTHVLVVAKSAKLASFTIAQESNCSGTQEIWYQNTQFTFWCDIADSPLWSFISPYQLRIAKDGRFKDINIESSGIIRQ